MKAKKASRRQVLLGQEPLSWRSEGALSAGTCRKDDQGLPSARILREVVLEALASERGD
jgi:hypothetical protein